MTIKSSGPLAMTDIQAEFGGTYSLRDYYFGGSYVKSYTAGGSIPSSGPISFKNFYGANGNPSYHYANAAGFNGDQSDDGMAFSLDFYNGVLTLNIGYWTQYSNGTEIEYGSNYGSGEQFALRMTTSGTIVFGTSANAVNLRQVYGTGDYIYTYWNAGTFTQTYASGATESVTWPTARVAARWNGGNSVTIFLNNSYRNSGDTGTNYAFTEGQYSFGTGWAGTYYVPQNGYIPASSGPYTAYNITW
jgi:hypothetical protein